MNDRDENDWLFSQYLAGIHTNEGLDKFIVFNFETWVTVDTNSTKKKLKLKYGW